MQLFLDMDGVLADFSTFATQLFGMHPLEFRKYNTQDKFWEVLTQVDNFFEQLPPMSDAMHLWESTVHLEPIILTAVPDEMPEAHEQKVRWAQRHFGSDVKIITTKSAIKYTHMIPDKTNILIDDWAKYKPLWEDKGGHFIVHTSAEQSLKELSELMETL